MSRLGKQPITIPAGVEVTLDGGALTVKGPKATLTKDVKEDVSIKIDAGSVTLEPAEETKEAKALWGTYAAHLHNMIKGVTEGFEKILQIEGVGYRAEVRGNSLVLNVGFSHPVELEIPAGISAEVVKNEIKLLGNDKEALGQFAANVRKVKKPEPYKGKGIKYVGERILRKSGKSGKDK
ncbi:50S ribosomal protein L6 [Candidatus Saccharibacteria bacterium]|nr:50S ribosomal protein L6 [Candidatus Saccharibacteria bacterium]